MIPNETIIKMAAHLKHDVDIFQNKYISDVKNLNNIKKDIVGYESIDRMNEQLGYKLTYKDLENIKTGCCSTKILNDFRTIRSNLKTDRQSVNVKNLLAAGFTLCTRCGGSGKHSYNQKTGRVCFKCNGVGAIEKVME